MRRIQDQSRTGMAWEMLRRAVHKTIARVEDATEDLAAGKAAIEEAADPEIKAEAEGALPEKLAYFEETTSQQEGAVLQVIRSFADALAEGGFAGPTEGEMQAEGPINADTSETAVLRDYVVASLRSFMREYHVQAAEVEQQIQENILPKATEEVRAVIEEQLRM